MTRSPFSTPFAAPVLFQPAANPREPVRDGTEFVMPKDANVVLDVWAPWNVWAVDEQAIKIRLNGLEYEGHESVERSWFRG